MMGVEAGIHGKHAKIQTLLQLLLLMPRHDVTNHMLHKEHHLLAQSASTHLKPRHGTWHLNTSPQYHTAASTQNVPYFKDRTVPCITDPKAHLQP